MRFLFRWLILYPGWRVVLELLHQHALAPNRVQHLNQQSSEQLLRRYRRPAYLRIQLLEQRRKLLEDPVHDLTDTPKRMVPRNTFLRRQVTDDPPVRRIVSSHRE